MEVTKLLPCFIKVSKLWFVSKRYTIFDFCFISRSPSQFWQYNADVEAEISLSAPAFATATIPHHHLKGYDVIAHIKKNTIPFLYRLPRPCSTPRQRQGQGWRWRKRNMSSHFGEGWSEHRRSMYFLLFFLVFIYILHVFVIIFFWLYLVDLVMLGNSY